MCDHKDPSPESIPAQTFKYLSYSQFDDDVKLNSHSFKYRMHNITEKRRHRRNANSQFRFSQT